MLGGDGEHVVDLLGPARHEVRPRRPIGAAGDHPAGAGPGLGDALEMLCRQLELSQPPGGEAGPRSEEHTSELQSLMRISYAVFCLKKKNNKKLYRTHNNETYRRHYSATK